MKKPLDHKEHINEVHERKPSLLFFDFEMSKVYTKKERNQAIEKTKKAFKYFYRVSSPFYLLEYSSINKLIEKIANSPNDAIYRTEYMVLNFLYLSACSAAMHFNEEFDNEQKILAEDLKERSLKKEKIIPEEAKSDHHIEYSYGCLFLAYKHYLVGDISMCLKLSCYPNLIQKKGKGIKDVHSANITFQKFTYFFSDVFYGIFFLLIRGIIPRSLGDCCGVRAGDYFTKELYACVHFVYKKLIENKTMNFGKVNTTVVLGLICHNVSDLLIEMMSADDTVSSLEEKIYVISKFQYCLKEIDHEPTRDQLSFIIFGAQVLFYGLIAQKGTRKFSFSEKASRLADICVKLIFKKNFFATAPYSSMIFYSVIMFYYSLGNHDIVRKLCKKLLEFGRVNHSLIETYKRVSVIIELPELSEEENEIQLNFKKNMEKLRVNSHKPRHNPRSIQIFRLVTFGFSDKFMVEKVQKYEKINLDYV